MIKTAQFIALFFLCVCMLIGSAEASDSKSNSELNFKQTIKELVMKGSVDGESAILVYGVNNAIEDMKKLFGYSFSRSEIIDLKSLIKTEGDSYREYGQTDDFRDSVHRGVNWTSSQSSLSSKSFKNIFKRSWKSLKKMKKSYKINFNNAREAYDNADNRVVGAVNYSAHAVYAQFEGAYYLVVQAPVMIVTSLAQTLYHGANALLALPISILAQTFRTAGHVLWIGARFVVVNSVSLLTGAYSAISTSTAAAVVTVMAGGVAVFNGVKFIGHSIRSIFRKVNIEIETSYKKYEQLELAQMFKETSKDIFNQLYLKRDKIQKYRSKFVFYTGPIKALVVRFRIIKKKVIVQAEYTKRYFQTIKKQYPGLKKKEIIARLRNQLKLDIVNAI